MRIVPLLLCFVVGCGDYLAVELGGLLTEQIEAWGRDAGAAPSERTCTPTPNRCGPPGLGFVIPDCPLGVVCFSEACNNHDICYGTCGTSRATCDSEFFEELASICSEDLMRYDLDFARCLSLAYVYWQTSVRFGQGLFDDAQRHACACHEAEFKPVVQVGDRAGTTWTGAPFDDADDDLLPDDWEASVGLDPTDPADALKDFDSDGLVNLGEFIWGTDPYDSDTDGNGVIDGV